MLSRRAMLGAMAATPLAAKAAAQQAVQSVPIGGMSRLGSGMVGTAMWPTEAPESPIEFARRRLNQIRKLLGMGLPEWKKQELWERAGYIEGFDADIAAKRSWSMSVKVLEQRQRNYQRMLARIELDAERHVAELQFGQDYDIHI